MKKIIIILFALLFTGPLFSQKDEVFKVGTISAKRGEKVSGKLIVEEGIDKGSFIPITIVQGKKPGPVLNLNAGIHGTEYVPVIALQRIRQEINPDELSGILILIQVRISHELLQFTLPAFQRIDLLLKPAILLI